MNTLVINSGSSSIKFSLYQTDGSAPDLAAKCLFDGELSGIGTSAATLDFAPNAKGQSVNTKTQPEAIHLVLDAVSRTHMPAIDAIGYRVVHPGPKLHDHTLITPQVLDDLADAIPFAPLHDPAVIQLIREAMERFPLIPHYACFDTIFHQTMPPEATTYPIPQSIRDQGVHRYGFHGLSCESAVYQLRRAAGISFPANLIVAHLGSGCSVTAIQNGKSVANTMGLTPTGGVLMGTRPGDLDPGLIFYLLRQPNATVESVEHLLNHDSGLKSLGGINDMRKLREISAREPQARLAIAVFTRSIRMAVAGYASIFGLDALVFTGGIGEHDPKTRWDIGNGLFPSGDSPQPEIEPAANEAKLSGKRKISAEESNIAVYVLPAQEDLMIALHVSRMSTANIP